ncbi:MAG: CHASE2 domain-containing protein [Candidatus Omnitrophica bacterium]|nr:CHASE2 domain-containing protein [Candidatus Omnitrophota bacterium]
MVNPLKKVKRLFQKTKSVKLSSPAKDSILALIVGIIVAAAAVLGIIRKFEFIYLDNMFRLRGEGAVNENIIIVGIDDKSLEILGRWPWPREYHASFLQIINQYDPRFVIFDILFPETDPGGDAALASVAQEAKNLYLASYFVLREGSESLPPEVDRNVPKLPYLSYDPADKDEFVEATEITLPVKRLEEAAKSSTVINAPHDIDGAIRHVLLVIEFNGKVYPTVSLQLACDYLDVNISDVRLESGSVILPLKEGDIRIPIDSQGRMVLNFKGPITVFKQYSFIQILHDYNRALKDGRESILENFRDKIVFVGQTATGSVDLRIMPFSNLYPAVGVHATALGNILDRDLMRKTPLTGNIFIIILSSLALGLSLKKGRKLLTNLGLMLGLFLSFAAFSFILFSFFRIWIYTFSPLLAILLTYVAVSISHFEAVRYEKKILENELMIAMTIQQSFLPKTFPAVPFLEFAARCDSAKHVGGDLYDFVKLEGDKIGIAIGDVSGKGVPAALYMARAISELRSVSRTVSDAAETLKTINNIFSTEGMEKSFITMQYLTFDMSKKNKTVFSNGGHNTLLHFIKEKNKVEEIDTEGGMPIGVMDGIDFDNKEISFARGDILFLYSDGISEAMDKRRRQFGIERMIKIIIDNSHMNAEKIMSKMYDEVAVFSKGVPQHDDMTVVIIKAI